MAHISSIGAGLFSDLAFTRSAQTSLPANETAWKALFATDDTIGGAGTGFFRVPDVREFPSIGTPANIVNVPVYGSAISQQVQGQADAPSLEVQINFKPEDWQDATNYLGALVGDSVQRAFRFALLNADPAAAGGDYTSVNADPSIGGTSGAEVENSQYFWLGKIEALLVNPQLTDSNTATLTLSVQSDFYGAYTTDLV